MNLEELVRNALEKISKSIEDDTLVLPRVPEVVEKIDAAIADENSSLKEIGGIIQYESSISARILQIANSPLVRGNSNITSLHSAITRIGLDMVRNLVLCMGIKDAFITRNPFLKRKMKEIWDNNISIAMYAYFLAKHFKLNEDFAMMAGMLHSLGKLPIIDYAGKHSELVEDTRVFDYLINTLQKPLGIKILRQWEFDDELISVVENYDEIDKDRPGEVDVVDIVVVAYCFQSDTQENPLDWYRVKALRKMRLSRNELCKILQTARGEVAEMSNIMFT